MWIRPDKAREVAARSMSSKEDQDWVIGLIEEERQPHTALLHMTSSYTGKLSVMFYGITLSVYDSEIIRA